MRKTIVVAPALVVVLFIVHCAHMKVPPPPMTYLKLCPGGQGYDNRRGPIVCIDANTLTANRDHQHVKKGSWILFVLTDTSHNLDIKFDEEVKVQFKGQLGNRCWLRIRDDAPEGPAPYTPIIMGVSKGGQDPDVMIDP
jgi:hypothetical protein